MALQTVQKDDIYVLNHCTKYLARVTGEARHNFGQFDAADPRSHIAEAWRFPIIDSFSDGRDPTASYGFNEVTFVYMPAPGEALPANVAIIGTFANLHDPVPLRRIPDTPYFTLTAVVPKGEIHTYKYILDGQPFLDKINPQEVTLANGKRWSRFFTHLCSQPITLEDWELSLLERITNHFLPFNTEEGKRFIERYYDTLAPAERQTQYVHAYRLDQPVGVVNFIDKLLAKEERHHLLDYRACLPLIDSVLRQRNPFVEPRFMPEDMYVQLYGEMERNFVPGWDTNRYRDPAYFLQLIRRHTFSGAFTHPKYGGNAGAAGWAYLEERFRDPQGQTLFNWRRILEKPLGTSEDYKG